MHHVTFVRNWVTHRGFSSPFLPDSWSTGFLLLLIWKKQKQKQNKQNNHTDNRFLSVALKWRTTIVVATNVCEVRSSPRPGWRFYSLHLHSASKYTHSTAHHSAGSVHSPNPRENAGRHTFSGRSWVRVGLPIRPCLSCGMWQILITHMLHPEGWFLKTVEFPLTEKVRVSGVVHRSLAN